MPRTFNDELLKYSGDQELLTKLDDLWEKNRDSSTAFLHEVPPRYLTAFIKTVEGLLNGKTLVDTKQYRDYQELSKDTTRRLSYALGYMQDLVNRNRGFSRSAIRGWIATLSVPLEGRSTEEVKQELDDAPDMEGEDWLRHARTEFEEFKKHVIDPSLRGPTPLADMPSHVAIGKIEQGMQTLGSLVNMVLLFMEKVDGEHKEVGQALQEFNQDMERLMPGGTKGADPAPTEVDKHEQQRLNMELYHTEILPKLNNMARPFDSIGDMNRSEILALSACLDVAIRARDNNRR